MTDEKIDIPEDKTKTPEDKTKTPEKTKDHDDICTNIGTIGYI